MYVKKRLVHFYSEYAISIGQDFLNILNTVFLQASKDKLYIGVKLLPNKETCKEQVNFWEGGGGSPDIRYLVSLFMVRLFLPVYDMRWYRGFFYRLSEFEKDPETKAAVI